MGLNFLRRKRNMGHEALRESLSEYMDGRLSADERATVESHLLECQECSRELHALRATRQMLQSLPPIRLPRGFTLEATPNRALQPRGFYWLRAATGLAAAAFVVLLTLPNVLPIAGSSSAIHQAARATSQITAADGRGSSTAESLGQGAASAERAAEAQRSLAPAAPAAAAPAPTRSAASNPAQPLTREAPSLPAVSASAAEGQSRIGQVAQGAAGTTARSTAGYQAQASEVPGRPSLWPLLQGLAGGLALLLGLTTGGIWWHNRRR